MIVENFDMCGVGEALFFYIKDQMFSLLSPRQAEGSYNIGGRISFCFHVRRVWHSGLAQLQSEYVQNISKKEKTLVTC